VHKPKARSVRDDEAGREGLTAFTDGITDMDFSVERRFQVPADAPARLVEDIETYSAFVEMQSKMNGASAWYQRLA